MLPACGHYGLGVVPYCPLARGVLTGEVPPRTRRRPPGSRAARQDKRMLETEWRPEILEIAQRIQRPRRGARHHAGAFRDRLGAATTGWSPGCIVGPRTEAHLEDYLAALAYRFTAEDEALVDALVVTGHPSTPGYNDPQYPIEGRIPATS